MNKLIKKAGKILLFLILACLAMISLATVASSVSLAFHERNVLFRITFTNNYISTSWFWLGWALVAFGFFGLTTFLAAMSTKEIRS